LSNFTGNGTAQVYQLTSANAIARLSDLSYSGAGLNVTLPAQSVTLFVLPAGTGTGNKPPVASFTAAPASGNAPLAVSFNASASSDPDGNIVSYTWSFGDGATSTGVTASHTYTAAGNYTATLSVKDNAGATAVATKTIVVTAPPPTGCGVSYTIVNDWGNGFQASVTITNYGSQAINSWTLKWQYAGNQKVTDIWNATKMQSGKALTVRNASWNTTIGASGGTVNFGFNATYSGTNAKPTAFTLNGQACQLK
jgi:PKD repeat protein